MDRGVIVKVAGPLVVAEGLGTAKMYDLVRVGAQGLMGEIIEMRRDRASIQVYEETEGLGPGDPVEATGAPLSVELGPGLLESVYDGVQRPLDELERLAGAFLARGVSAPGLDRDKRWEFVATAAVGSRVSGGQIVGTVAENVVIEHRIMVPPAVSGTLEELASGSYTVTDAIGAVRTGRGRPRRAAPHADVAGAHAAPVRAQDRADRAARVRHARHRHVLPARQGRHRLHPGAVRRRQDGHPAPGRQVVQRAGRRLHRLRRARQRDDRRAHGVPRADRPGLRRAAHEAHRPRRQHLEHAGRRPRGVRLHRHHHGRVLPRHGLRRRPAGRLDVALGRGDARDLRSPRRDARRRGLPGVPGHEAGRVLRARRQGRVPRGGAGAVGGPASGAVVGARTVGDGRRRPRRGPVPSRSSGPYRLRVATSPSRSFRTRSES